jgi:hypothetical protein
MGRKPVVIGNTKTVGGESTNPYSVKRRVRVIELPQWVYDIEQALNRARVRKHSLKEAEEKGKISGDMLAAKYMASRLKLLNQVREILDVVPAGMRDPTWIEKDAWEVEERKSVPFPILSWIEAHCDIDWCNLMPILMMRQ